MYLHIGEGLLVRKKEIITILDARKMVAAENSQLFFDAFPVNHQQKDHLVKSFVMVEILPKRRKRRRMKECEKKREKRKETLVLVSTIASTTLQKRFHGQREEMMDIEAREIHGKPTKQL